MMITETAAAAATAGVVLQQPGSGGGKIKRSSFKSRGSGGSFKGYRTVRVTVPSTMVAELASKFNAVVVDADRGATARDIIKKVNKTLARGAAVRATVEKFESAADKKPTAHVVVVRTNSDKRTPSAGDAASVTVAKPSPSPPPPLSPSPSPATVAPSSIVKRRMQQFQTAGKRPPKPSVLGPKPDLARLRKPQQQQRKDAAQAELPNKLKRLSIARDPDARLESVLNAAPPQQQWRPSASPPNEMMHPKPNSSFLHGRKSATAVAAPEPVTTAVPESVTTPVPESVTTPVPKPDGPQRSPSPLVTAAVDDDDDGYNYIANDGAGERTQAIYEELCDMQAASAAAMATDPSPLPDVVPECAYYDGANDHHYTTIESADEQNIYDDVITAAAADRENRKRLADDGSYETVQPPPPPPPPQQPSPSAVVGSAGGCLEKKLSGDSSVEIDNSIYGVHPPSESTSSGKYYCIFRPFGKHPNNYRSFPNPT